MHVMTTLLVTPNSDARPPNCVVQYLAVCYVAVRRHALAHGPIQALMGAGTVGGDLFVMACFCLYVIQYVTPGGHR